MYFSQEEAHLAHIYGQTIEELQAERGVLLHEVYRLRDDKRPDKQPRLSNRYHMIREILRAINDEIDFLRVRQFEAERGHWDFPVLEPESNQVRLLHEGACPVCGRRVEIITEEKHEEDLRHFIAYDCPVGHRSHTERDKSGEWYADVNYQSDRR